MCDAFLVLVVNENRIWPSLVPVCAEGEKTSFGHKPVNGFPFLYVLDREAVITVALNLFRHIYNNKRQQHFLHTNLVKFSAASGKMPGRIHMRSPLTDQGHFFQPESV